MTERCGHCYLPAVATIVFRPFMTRVLRRPAERRAVCGGHLDRYRKGGRAARRAG